MGKLRHSILGSIPIILALLLVRCSSSQPNVSIADSGQPGTDAVADAARDAVWDVVTVSDAGKDAEGPCVLDKAKLDECVLQ
jgi:hypothetical protein